MSRSRDKTASGQQNATSPGKPMPVLFVGHGNPMNAIEDNDYSRGWEKLGREIARPAAILCVSAHWETDGTRVSPQRVPRTIHDFYGFPRELYDVRYPCPGIPALAEEIVSLLGEKVTPDDTWGIDHGAWSVLRRMYPEADIPVVQLSLDYRKPEGDHFETARSLASLRDRGVLIVGSGNLVHNLRLMRYSPNAARYDWAVSFDETVSQLIGERRYNRLIEYHHLGREADLSIPTNEHFLPLLYVLAAAGEDDSITFPITGIDLGSVSMRTVLIG